jgi:beta-lactamase superfamily II metal-dependent hydrolase
MIDCGHNTTTAWRPSLEYCATPIDQLTVSNYDEDHCSDIPGMFDHATVRQICRNTTVNADVLGRLKKEGGMGTGIARFQLWMQRSVNAPVGTPIDWGAMRLTSYHNNYPTFDDENNLSVVTFVTMAAFKIVFPGDMEAAGWLRLLQDARVQAELRTVRIFVASHHGRANGCCNDVFTYCHPDVVLMSDDEIQYDTQDTVKWYGARAKGLPPGGAFGARYVLTTRNDRHMRIEVDDGGGYSISTNVPQASYR